MNAKDTYIKLTDPLGKSPTIISYHRTWDENRFIASVKVNFEDKAQGDDIRVVERSSEAEYRKFMGYKNV